MPQSTIGTLRAYFYPHMQRQKSMAGVARIYQEKTDYYNHRVHWDEGKDDVKTPLGRLGTTRGRELPEHFELSVLATAKRFPRTVDGTGFLSFKRYRLYVDTDLKRQRVEIREFKTHWSSPTRGEPSFLMPFLTRNVQPSMSKTHRCSMSTPASFTHHRWRFLISLRSSGVMFIAARRIENAKKSRKMPPN